MELESGMDTLGEWVASHRVAIDVFSGGGDSQSFDYG